MSWYVMVVNNGGTYATLMGADDRFYEGLRKRTEASGTEVMGARTGVPDSHIDELGHECNTIVKRLEDGEHVDVASELARFDVVEPLY
ncbi:MAG: hypothetical protein HYS81_01605 [Candidatus Aenigmatarchaeota archaeon]|nr:MAG: hypothetical protein HYS81_01605 [Candidatus Aenigmarchaeota archaeon]